MIKIKLSSKDKYELKFKSYTAIVSFLRQQAIPFEFEQVSMDNISYKRKVSDRCKIMYGQQIHIYEDKSFVNDLHSLGELNIISEGI